MSERIRNIAVGLTALVGLVGLAAMMLLFGYVPGWLEPTYTITVQLPTAAGLAEGSRVQYSGIDVGTISSVQLKPPPQRGVVVLASVREEVELPVDLLVTVYAPPIGGMPSLQLNPRDATSDVTVMLPKDGSAVLEGDGAAGSFAGTLSRELRAAMEQPLRDFAEISKSFGELSEQWTLVGENINQLVEPRDPALVDSGEASPSAASVLARLDARLAQLDTTLAGINRIVEDDQLHDDLRATLANARSLSESLPGRVDELSQSIDSNLTDLQRRYVALADDFAGSARSLQQVLDQASAGDGTLGKLIHDPSLYNNLNDATERMQKTIDELRLLIQKWQAEGVPVQF